ANSLLHQYCLIGSKIVVGNNFKPIIVYLKTSIGTPLTIHELSHYLGPKSLLNPYMKFTAKRTELTKAIPCHF
ncbi:hypothetical protein, partial [Legionella parisiensis]|uniref:hypothetical protein n=1 Tax=Legionella parisiensis TaxID=45071 RepID=UPI001969BBEB